MQEVMSSILIGSTNLTKMPMQNRPLIKSGAVCFYLSKVRFAKMGR